MKKIFMLLFAVLLVLSACSSKSDTDYLTIELDEVQQLQNNGSIILDVREVDEFAEGHIIGAINLPLSKLKEGNREGLDKDQSYVVICRSGNRSKEASTILAKDNYDIVNVSEGMSSWTGEVEK